MVLMYPFVHACSVVLLKYKFLITCNVIMTVFAAVYFPVICSNAVVDIYHAHVVSTEDAVTS